MYSSYEQTDRSSFNPDHYETTSTTNTTYRSAVSPRINNVSRSRPTGLNSSGVSTRIYRNYLSTGTTNSFGPGLASLVNASGIPLRTTPTAVVSINTTRQKEKRDLEHLNDKFAQYVEKVRFLEANNRKLVLEIETLRNRSEQGTSRVREMYDIEIAEANKLIDDTKRDAAEIYRKKQQAEEELLHQRARYNNVRDSREADRRAIDSLQLQIAENEAQIALFRRRMADLEDESRRYKAECQRISSEIARLQNEIQNELFLKSSCEIEKLAVEDELINLRQIQESDLVELRSKSITNDLDPSQFFSNELSEAIREIRSQYETIMQNRRNELQNNYSVLINEIQILTQRDSNSSFDEPQRQQAERTRQEVLEIQKRNGYLTHKRQDMLNAIADLERKIKDLNARERIARTKSDRDIAEARRHLDDIERTYIEATTLKTTLEKEIATYRDLLESPNGLRSCVNRAVQNTERDSLNRSNSGHDLYNRNSNYSEERLTKTTKTTSILRSSNDSTSSYQNYLEPTSSVIYRSYPNRPSSPPPPPPSATSNYYRSIPVQDETKQYRSTWQSAVSDSNKQQRSIIQDYQQPERTNRDNRTPSPSSSSSSDSARNEKQDNPVYETFSDN